MIETARLQLENLKLFRPRYHPLQTKILNHLQNEPPESLIKLLDQDCLIDLENKEFCQLSGQFNTKPFNLIKKEFIVNDRAASPFFQRQIQRMAKRFSLKSDHSRRWFIDAFLMEALELKNAAFSETEVGIQTDYSFNWKAKQSPVEFCGHVDYLVTPIYFFDQKEVNLNYLEKAVCLLIQCPLHQDKMISTMLDKKEFLLKAIIKDRPFPLSLIATDGFRWEFAQMGPLNPLPGSDFHSFYYKEQQLEKQQGPNLLNVHHSQPFDVLEGESNKVLAMLSYFLRGFTPE